SAAPRCVQECATPSNTAGSPADSPVCVRRPLRRHPAQTASSRYSVIARPRDGALASVSPLCVINVRTRHANLWHAPEAEVADAPDGLPRARACGDEAWRQTGFAPQMDVHV